VALCYPVMPTWGATAFLPIASASKLNWLRSVTLEVTLKTRRLRQTHSMLVRTHALQEVVVQKGGAGKIAAQAVGLFHYTFLHSHNVFGAFTSGALLHLIAHR
jgi:hypothetical protein